MINFNKTLLTCNYKLYFCCKLFINTYLPNMSSKEIYHLVEAIESLTRYDTFNECNISICNIFSRTVRAVLGQ